MTLARSNFQLEVPSARRLEELASLPLPLGIASGEPRRTLHRDFYLDTDDDALRSRQITCRLRTDAGGSRSTLSLHFGAASSAARELLEAKLNVADPLAALADDNAVARRLRKFVAPESLVVRVITEVERLTRTADRDWLGRARIELHYDRITVRRNSLSRTFFQLCGHTTGRNGMRLRDLAAALQRELGLHPSAADTRDRAALAARWMRSELPVEPGMGSDWLHRVQTGETAQQGGELFNPELSLLSFQLRVLSLAEDPRTPLGERLRFLGIVAANVDEFFMIRVAGLRASALEPAEEQGDDGLTSGERLDRVMEMMSVLLQRQQACYHACMHDLAVHGVQLVRWEELHPPARAALREHCMEEIQPALTPLAMTLSPGHPLPHLPHLSLSLAVVFRDREGGTPHVAQLEIPSEVPRFLEVPNRPGSFVTIEEAVRANLDLVYPNSAAQDAWLFRVTRGGELDVDEEMADDLLDAVEHATERRQFNPAVRVEFEQAMPEFVRELVMESLRRESRGTDLEPGTANVHEVQGLVDLRSLSELPLPPIDGIEHAPLDERAPPAFRKSVFDAVRERELLVHHPFDSFDATVVRFIQEAAADADVVAIKITLYRMGHPSPIVDALIEAARRGKRVVAFVELRARFDEGRNASWARALEQAGGNVVYGLVGYKNHAKVALVVRREPAGMRRYVHVGTGNYNSRSGRQYTDLSLFSAREALTADVADLFNELTGSARPPHALTRGALLAPHQLLPAILDLIEDERQHALAGRPARITARMNGLSDPDVIRALYRASGAGVEIDLMVRGICTLRPGVPGLSERIRVSSVVGRFLEHSRIYRFQGGGERIHLIGSADLRPRNLRRRVELLVPVVDEECRTLLDEFLELYLNDPTAWELGPQGEYTRRTAAASGAQAVLAARAMLAARGNASGAGAAGDPATPHEARPAAMTGERRQG